MSSSTPSQSHSRWRSRSPQRHPDRPSKRSRRLTPPRQTPQTFPLSAQPISKHDLRSLRPLFVLYLDIQKQLDIEDIPEDEVKGRWKSFVKKWNSGDLAEGWYDPGTLRKALSSASTQIHESERNEGHPIASEEANDDEQDKGEVEDDFGPSLPTAFAISNRNSGNDNNNNHSTSSNVRETWSGAAPPSLNDLRTRREEADEEAREARKQHHQHIRDQRRRELKTQKERLDEIAPRAEAGTRDRQLEKKRELASSNRAFATAAHDSGDVDLPENDVMGDDTLSEFKQMKQREERRKTERELKREEVLRARMAEREEKVGKLRAKEEETMKYLMELKRERFG